MPISRPTTPTANSDTSSEPDSLSDLDSGWTDLSSTRSGGRNSPSTTSDVGDSEDERSAINRYEVETWDRVAPEDDHTAVLETSDDAQIIELNPTAHPVHSPQPLQATSEPALEEWVADALGSSLISNVDSLDTPTPHMSMRGSRSALRLAFPDPLSNSEDNLLPSRAISRSTSQSTDVTSEAEGDGSAHTKTPSSFAPTSFTGTLSSDRSSSVPRDDTQDDESSNEGFDLPSLELIPSSPVSYALSVVLVGHPPLPHLKSMTMLTLMEMVAAVLDGTPVMPQGTDLTRIYEVPIQSHHSNIDGVQSDEPVMHRILISDRTSGSSASLSLSTSTVDCPTLAVFFIQPPLSSPAFPSLPLSTRFLPLLLPSVSDGFASSLLDLSPSVLFDHSVPNISTPDYTARKSFASQQCIEMNIVDARLDDTRDILTVDEFVGLPVQRMSSALKEVIFPPKDKSEESFDKEATTSGISIFRKQIVFMSAFLIALLFGSTVLLKGKLTETPVSVPSIPPQSQRAWPFLHPFVGRAPSTSPTTPPLSSAPADLTRTRALTPASLKSLAVSVFLPETTTENLPGPSTVPRSSPEIKGIVKKSTASKTTDEHARVRIASIDSAARPLTLDPPVTKSLSLSPASHFPSAWKGKGKALDTFRNVPNPLPTSFNSLSTCISKALAPLFDAAKSDLQELHEAIDALLRALLQLQGACKTSPAKYILPRRQLEKGHPADIHGQSTTLAKSGMLANAR
ncbi:hypothetical protein K439DRAFT_812463 [Ramaria rubella]|nr:hypothetical protein K439DRAFT_812463 [Ramaria rubella]